MLPRRVGGHVEPSASVNTFPGYYCLFSLEEELHENFKRQNIMQSSTVYGGEDHM